MNTPHGCSSRISILIVAMAILIFSPASPWPGAVMLISLGVILYMLRKLSGNLF